MDEDGPRPRDYRGAALRIVAAMAVALAFGLGVYALLEATRPTNGLISFSFLLMLPAAISAFVAYVADPWGERRLGAYMMVPVWLLLAVVLVSIFALKEGAVCVIMLAPLWVGSGAAGAAITYHLRRRLRRGRTYCLAMLALPLVVMQVEPHVPLPAAGAVVTRSIIVEAPPERIWPLLRGIPDVRPGEGRWNLSQDVIGVPRPLGARLVGEGVGAERLAKWGTEVSFRERITEWSPGRRIGWRFIFDDVDGWRFTDRHLTPDSAYFRVTTGGYSLTPLGEGRTRLTLETRYWMKTPVNGYSALWGQFFLGDLEGNLLALVKNRAEQPVS
uniref:Polyketide cyclase/dehydrase n=1 Tax=Caulobacter sp. (strain K31) TaxID=366602 RepID=B0SX25_CAUSK